MIIYNGQPYSSLAEVPEGFNRSFRYGDGLFETIRVFRGQTVFTEAHFDRLRKGVVLLGYTCDWESWKQEVLAGVEQILAHQESAGPGRIRLHVWREGTGAYAPQEDGMSYLIEYAVLPTEYFEEPGTVHLSDFHGMTLRDSPLSRIKTASALPYVLAARQARDAGTDDVVMYAEDGTVAETSSSNLFILNKQTVMTPPLSSGCLEGTMRRLVIDICQSLSFVVSEEAISAKTLKKAEAVFLTNSIRGIRAVREYGHVIWKDSAWSKVVFLQKSLLKMATQLTNQGKTA